MIKLIFTIKNILDMFIKDISLVNRFLSFYTIHMVIAFIVPENIKTVFTGAFFNNFAKYLLHQTIEFSLKV